MSSDEYSFSVVYYSILYVPPAHPSVLVADDEHHTDGWVVGPLCRLLIWTRPLAQWGSPLHGLATSRWRVF